MSSVRRTQSERRAATRGALVAAARRLFAQRGYAAVGTEEIVREAGVTRGALYHHFDGKEELLAAVYEQIEADLLERLAGRLQAEAAADPMAALVAGAEAFLDACLEPEVHRVVLLDAPSVLGYERWREIGWRYGGGLTEAALQAAMDAGQIARRPVRPLTHLLVGAIDEAALYVARAPDPRAARDDMAAAVRTFLDALRQR